jgi:hypothetical protein
MNALIRAEKTPKRIPAVSADIAPKYTQSTTNVKRSTAKATARVERAAAEALLLQQKLAQFLQRLLLEPRDVHLRDVEPFGDFRLRDRFVETQEQNDPFPP